MPASRSCKHPAIILAVSSRHAAPRRVLILLQSRLSQVVIPHHATVAPYCNPGSRKSSFRRNAESSVYYKAVYPYGCPLDSAFQRNDDLTLRGRICKSLD